MRQALAILVTSAIALGAIPAPGAAQVDLSGCPDRIQKWPSEPQYAPGTPSMSPYLHPQFAWLFDHLVMAASEDTTPGTARAAEVAWAELHAEVRRDPQTYEMLLADMINGDAGAGRNLESMALGKAVELYRAVSGRPIPLLHYFGVGKEFLRFPWLLDAITTTLDDRSQAVVLRMACDAAWVYWAWEGRPEIRQNSAIPDLASWAARVLQGAYRVSDRPARQVIERLVRTASPQYGIAGIPPH